MTAIVIQKEDKCMEITKVPTSKWFIIRMLLAFDAFLGKCGTYYEEEIVNAYIWQDDGPLVNTWRLCLCLTPLWFLFLPFIVLVLLAIYYTTIDIMDFFNPVH